jgi:response regulator RpfG family c-di-GMP phosphodiesterase
MAASVPLSSLTPPERLSPAPATSAQHELLLVTTEPGAAAYTGMLRQVYRVVSTPNIDVAKQYLAKGVASLVVIDADVSGDVTGIIAAARKSTIPATVLVMVDDAFSVPELLQAGCDAVLLKPFAPNLLYARIGRLVRSRTEHQRSQYLDRDSSPATTNRLWADVMCPSCDHLGAISFEFASHRRAWYACLTCKSVWMAKRRE